MKKLLCIFLSITILCLCGCAASQPNTTAFQPTEDTKVELFSDEFFADVVGIGTFSHGKLSGKQMGPVIDLLKSLELKETDVLLNPDGELILGGNFLEFTMSDGSKLTFDINSTYLNSHDGYGNYEIVGGGLYDGLTKAYEQAKNITED